MKQVIPILIVIGAAFMMGCDHGSGMLATVPMKLGNKTFDIEIARTPDQQEKGLMERDSMPDDHGMIFIFPAERVVDFWMKNTRFPLDIIFLDSKGTVVSIKQMKAYDRNTTSSEFSCQYAIEINKDAAGNAGVKVGDHVDIPSQAASKP